MASEALLQELHQILKRDYGKNLKRNELVEIADSLINYFSLLAKINAREQAENKNYENKNNTKQN